MPRFQTKPVAPVQVDAVQLTVPIRFGKQKGRTGDYLVTHPDNRQELVAGAAFLATYEPANGTGDLAVVDRAQARPAPSKKNGGPGKGGRPPAPDTEKAKTAARKLWESGAPVKEIARTLKRTVSAVYKWSAEGKWQRPKPGAVAAATGGAEQLAGSVRCTSCDVMTSWDPCEHCGSKLKRKW